MAFFNEFPNTRTYDKDLGWLIHVVGQLQIEVKTFIENNTINIPDQITWDITKQYTRNTLVIDYDGTAYLSKQPVPIGIAITNTDYWMPIFNYDDSINTLRANIATNERNHTTASAERHAGDLVWLGNALYKVTVDMPAGTAYIAGTNVELYTIEDYLLFLKGAIAAEAQARTEETGQLRQDLDSEIENRTNAVNQEVENRTNAINQETEDRTNAINQEIEDRTNAINQEIEDRTAAINHVNTKVANLFASVKNYGATGDGDTDDTDAIQNALNENQFVYFPAGTYRVTRTITVPDNTTIMGSGKANTIIIGKADMLASTILKGAENSNHICLRDLAIDYSATNRTAFPVVFKNCGRVKLYNCYFAAIDNTASDYSIVAFIRENPTVPTWAHTIENCVFYYTSLALNQNTDCQIVNNEFSCLENNFAIQCIGGGVILDHNMIIGTVLLENTKGNQINNNYFDGGDTHPVSRIIPAILFGASVYYTQINNNRFYVIPGCAIQIPSTSANVHCVTIENNIFQNCDDLLTGLPDIDSQGVQSSLIVSGNNHVRDSYFNVTTRQRVNRSGNERTNAPILLNASGTGATDTRTILTNNAVKSANTYTPVTMNDCINSANTPDYIYPQPATPTPTPTP